MACFTLRYRIQWYRFRIAIVLWCGIIAVLYFCLSNDIFESAFQFKTSLQVKYVKHVGNYSSACRLPNLDAFHPSVLNFVKDLGKLKCEGVQYSSFKNNVLEVKGKEISSVQYKTIERPLGDDFTVVLSDPVSLPNVADSSAGNTEKENTGTFAGKATIEADFVRVDIVTTSGETKSEVHMQASPKKEVVDRRLKHDAIPLDVALIMFDSTSAANFRRKLPSTLEYLTKDLNSVLLQGETIVGDGTTAQLSALLTGIAEQQQPEARRSKFFSSQSVDKWRWIFRDFKQKGYATLFSEDSPRFGTFNYRLHGFKDPPTEHYARPFWLEVDKMIDGYCIGSRASHNISLEYVLSFFRAYKDKPKFALAMHAVISHDDTNTIGYVDDDLKNILQTLEKEAFLDSTLLIIFADHGSRFSELRKTIQGKLEERLPFMSITAPKWFSEQYPDLFSNLVHNSKVLTTPFDVYATLRHILSYPSYPSGITTGQSLFNRIDADNRTCANAGVEDHWCPCLNLEEVSIDEPVIKELAEFAVRFLNDLIMQNVELEQLCHKLTLKKVTSAFRDMPSEQMQFFKKSKRNGECDSCGMVLGDKSINTMVTDTLYQLQFITSPNEGFYEASIKMNKGVSSLVGDISRIDAYKDQPYCIREKYPLLRKYCYCFSQRPN